MDQLPVKKNKLTSSRIELNTDKSLRIPRRLLCARQGMLTLNEHWIPVLFLKEFVDLIIMVSRYSKTIASEGFLNKLILKCVFRVFFKSLVVGVNLADRKTCMTLCRRTLQ